MAEMVPALVAGYGRDDVPVTFAALAAHAAEVAALIPNRARRVALSLPNSLEGVSAIAAVWASGASAVLMSDVLPTLEADRRAIEVGADVMLRREHGRWLSAAVARPTPWEGRVLADELVVIFTSGTTGRPKGVSKSDGAIGSMVATAAQISGPDLGRWPTEPPRQPYLVMSPLSHLQGLLGSLIAGQRGQPLLVMEKFDADRVFEIVNKFDIRTLRLGPAMVYDLTTKAAGRTLGGVRAVTVGTAELPDHLRLRFETCFGVPALQTYGQTETGTIAFERYNDVMANRRPPGSVGRLAPDVDVRIVGDDGDPRPTGEVGEVYARGPEAMSGYVDGDGSVASLHGFIATGDLGYLDEDGFLCLSGRLNDTIICGGFNVYPAVVEAALYQVASIREAVVVGIPDERLGEIPVAVVTLMDGSSLEEEAVLAVVREHLSPYELPRRMEVVSSLPRTTNGKLNREEVRASRPAPLLDTPSDVSRL
jgi:fatty-acyl-CoA synthase/O-succinylbenzoic acid--CoA ligase